MSRLSILAPLIREKDQFCSIPQKSALPEELTYLDIYMDDNCPVSQCDKCPYFYVLPAYRKLTP